MQRVTGGFGLTGKALQKPMRCNAFQINVAFVGRHDY